jgi:tetratricopeptide (TPR) repeat protein
MILLFAFMLLIERPPVVDLSVVEPQVATKIKVLEKRVIEKPQSAEAWGKLAMNLHAHDFQKESIECYAKAKALKPKDFRWTYYAAIAHQEIGSIDAILMFEESLKRKPNYAPLHLRYAQALFNAGSPDKATKEFQKVLELDSKSAEAHLGLARIAMAAKDSEEVRSQLSKAIELNPNLSEAHAMLSELYRSENNLEKSDEELLTAIRLPNKVPPPDPELNDFLMEGVSSYWYELRGRVLLLNGNYEGAIQELKQATRVLADPRFFDMMGIAYQHQKKFDEAVEQHRVALALNPSSAGTMNNLATALAELGDTTEAISYLYQAINAQPDFAYSYLHLAKLETPENALLVLRKGHQHLLDNSQLSLQLAFLLAASPKKDLRNCSEALQLATNASEKKGNQDAESLSVQSAAYACSEDFDRAIQTAQKAEQLATTSVLKRKIQAQVKQYLKKQIYYE